MELQRLSPIVIRWFRYLFLPIPGMFFFGLAEGWIIDCVVHGPQWGTFTLSRSEVGEVISFLAYLEVTQLFLGVVTLMLLDRWVRRLRSYVGITLLMTLLLVLAAAGYSHSIRPWDGSFAMAFVKVLGVLGVPLMLSFLLAWWLRALALRIVGEREGRI